MTRPVISGSPIPASWSRLSNLHKLLIVNGTGGALFGTLVSAYILFTDSWGLYTLIGGDVAPILAAFMFVSYGAVMFATLMVVTAVFLAGSDAAKRKPH